MGQSATLYRIGQVEFERLSKGYSAFSVSITKGRATFEQNFEGLLFLLSKLSSNSERALIVEIFCPNDSIGKTLEFDSGMINILDDLSFLETESIGYLSKEKIDAIRLFLGGIDKPQLLSLYNPEELNASGIYPCVWHSNESSDQAFNKRHIEVGFDKLVVLFNDAIENEDYILAFVG